MSNFIIKASDFHCHNFNGVSHNAIPVEKFNSFNESILGLGDTSQLSQSKKVISVIFDLEGFTNYCSEAEAPQQISSFLNDFLIWIFKSFRCKNIQKEDAHFVAPYSSFPFFSKFMGDGIMFLFDTSIMDLPGIHNVVVQMKEICEYYSSNFYPSALKKYSKIPTKLRCGIARGSVQSLGNDYVGVCINCSARLQKLDKFSFSFSLKEIDINLIGRNPNEFYLSILAPIRGIGESELIGVLKSDYNKLTEEDKLKYVVQN